MQRSQCRINYSRSRLITLSMASTAQKSLQIWPRELANSENKKRRVLSAAKVEVEAEAVASLVVTIKPLLSCSLMQRTTI